jgi:kynurenine 3-monooxygenase
MEQLDATTRAERSPRFTIVGGGMCGPLMALYLARRGYEVDVYERRGDPHRGFAASSKSIKMTLAARGLAALAEVGLADAAMRSCIPLYGRAIHSPQGTVSYQRYGKNEREVIYSISRSDLNELLVAAALGHPNVRFHFHQRCLTVDKETAATTFCDEQTKQTTRVEASAVIGADGAFSTVRQQVQRGGRADYEQDFCAWGYKEMSIAASALGEHRMDKHALHIWPRGDHMLFALPNLDGSFSVVLILPFDGDNSFAAFAAGADARRFFASRFPDAVPLMPSLREELQNHTGEFVTIRTNCWHYRGKVALVGDACHAVIPFYGQGMNAGFEDCSALDRCLARHPQDLGAAFALYQSLRKPNTDILAELSKRNFVELRDTSRSPWVTARKQALILLNRLLPRRVIPIYTLISHSTLPYTECVERARRQERLARLCGMDLLVGALAVKVAVQQGIAKWRVGREARGGPALPLASILSVPATVPPSELD